ncbi:MAG: hypothetical protein AABZ47_02545 [Planctomycetota bacterium]
MVRPLGFAASMVCVGGILVGSALGAVTVVCEPSDFDPTGNDVVLFDCTLVTDSPLLVNSYRMTMPCSATLEPGASGSINHFTIPSTPCTFVGADEACVNGNFQGTCVNSMVCFSPANCGPGVACLPDPVNPLVKYCENSGTCQNPSPFIDLNRDDYIFRGQTTFTPSISIGSCPGTPPFVSGVLPAATGALIDENSGAKYLGSFRHRVSTCAAGTFTINIAGNSTPALGSDQSRVISSTGVPIQVVGVQQGLLVEVGLCCDDAGCLGNHNAYCCRNVQGGLLAIPTTTCLPPNASPCVCTDPIENFSAQCDDFNACTDDFCAPGNPFSNEVGCLNQLDVPAGFCCDPTGHFPLDPLDDNNECTVDSCLNDEFPAVHDEALAEGNPCESDGNACTVDLCTNGACIHDAAAANGVGCPDDGNICTLDVCNNGVCTHSASGANGTTCVGDGQVCTIDICSNGVCTHPNISTFICGVPGDCPSGATGCSAGFCTCTEPGGPCYGDIYPPGTGNGFADVDDLICLLSGFANYGSCPSGDIFPCTPNGLIDVDDLIGMLLAFTGQALCGTPCG